MGVMYNDHAVCISTAKTSYESFLVIEWLKTFFLIRLKWPPPIPQNFLPFIVALRLFPRNNFLLLPFSELIYFSFIATSGRLY